MVHSGAGFEELLSLQELDTKLAQLAHAGEHHPLRAEISSERSAARAVEQLVAPQLEERRRLDREQRRLDDEVAMIDAKRTDIETRLYDGSVSATKDLLAMQEESRNLATRKSSLEDDELEIMEQIEGLAGDLDAAQGEMDAHNEAAAAKERDLDAALAELDAQAQEVRAERERVVADVPSDLLEAYESLRSGQGGIVVARLTGGTCMACNLNLSAVTVDQIGKLPADAIVHCDQCGAILVR